MIQNATSRGSEHELLAPLVEGWKGVAREGIRHKKRFSDVSEQCMYFFSGAVGFMWDKAYAQKFMGAAISPRFKITIAKAFELVALYGPTLYWRNPERVVKPRGKNQQRFTKAIEALPPEMQQQMQQLMQSLQQFGGQEMFARTVVSALLTEYLNYTPSEQPQGLAWHAQQMITESLIKGRGLLWVMPYRVPGSHRILTGCFHDSVDNLLIDPDATSLHDAKWIMKSETKPTHEWEREYGLPKDSLRNHGNVESAWSQGHRNGDGDALQRKAGKSFDMMTCYKVWSKAGVGTRLAGDARVSEPLAKALDEAVGDYAYLVISPDVRWPLNCPTEWMKTASDQEIVQRLSWPIEFWRDNKWPVVECDYYNRPNDPWPIAPLEPGLGELTFVNVMISALASKVYNTSRILFFGNEVLGEDVERTLKSGDDLAYGRLAGVQGKIQDHLEMVKFPEVNRDVFEMIERVMYMFDRRTGITELMAGMNPGGKIARVAEDVRDRSSRAQVRVDYMAAQVEDALSRASDLEKFCARQFVRPEHLDGLLNPAEQTLWGQYINGQNPEYVWRDFQATVVANSARKPDRAKDMEAFQQIAQYFFPFLQQYATQVGDFAPVNGVIEKWGEATGNDVQDLLIDGTAMQQMMQQQQEQAQAQAEAEAQAREQELQMRQQESMLQMQIRQQEHEMRMQQQQQTHQQKLVMAQESHLVSAQQGIGKLEQEAMRFALQQAQEGARFEQDEEQDEESHRQEIRQSSERHSQQMKQDKQKAELQRTIARRAASKPQPSGSRK